VPKGLLAQAVPSGQPCPQPETAPPSGARQAPKLQLAPLGQATLQIPQLSGSLAGLTQLPLQQIPPAPVGVVQALLSPSTAQLSPELVPVVPPPLEPVPVAVVPPLMLEEAVVETPPLVFEVVAEWPEVALDVDPDAVPAVLAVPVVPPSDEPPDEPQPTHVKARRAIPSARGMGSSTRADLQLSTTTCATLTSLPIFAQQARARGPP
jgi:hypothetical protein